MEEIDAELRAEGVPIPVRNIRAAARVADRFSVALPISGALREGAAPFSPADLSARIFQWYTARYGRRLAMDMRPGRLVVLIRGDAWELWIPRFYGTHLLTAAADQPTDPLDVGGSRSEAHPRYNVLDSITDLPAMLRDALEKVERADLLDTFRWAADGFRLVEAMPTSSLLRAAEADWESSTHHLLGPRPSPAQSKWSSLQFCEKILKEYLRSQGTRPPHSHDLLQLAQSAESDRFGVVPRASLAEVQVSPGARYGDVSVSLSDAVDAQHSAMDIAAHVSSFWVQDFK